jgi:hypothetical protein
MSFGGSSCLLDPEIDKVIAMQLKISFASIAHVQTVEEKAHATFFFGKRVGLAINPQAGSVHLALNGSANASDPAGRGARCCQEW